MKNIEIALKCLTQNKGCVKSTQQQAIICQLVVLCHR